MMRTHSRLVVDVRDALAAPGIRRPMRVEAVVEGLRAGLTSVPGQFVLDLTVEAIEGAVHVRGTVSGTFVGECRRCLEPVDQPFAYEASEFYRPRSDAWEEGYVIEDQTIDLGSLVRDNVLLNLPADPLCRPDCAGLCSRCGANLTDGPCGCPEDVDPRWSALRELGGELG